MTSVLELWCLGPWQASMDRKALPPLPTRHTRALLTCLALAHPQPISRHTLIQRLFPDTEPDHAARHLRTTLYYLRRALGNAVCVEDDRVGLSATLHVIHDVGRFEQAAVPDATWAVLHAALNTYRGPFLSGAVQGWAIDEAQRLHTLYVDVLRRVVALAQVAQIPAGALDAARRWAEAEPWEEAAHHALLSALIANGDRSGAEAQLVRARTVLADEWGAGSDDRFGALARAITRLPLNHTPPTHVGSHAPLVDLTEFDRLPLIGRTAQLDQLLAAWQTARAGTSHALVVEGVAGIGKTRLLHELAARVRGRADSIVLWGSAHEQTHQHALGLLRTAFAHVSAAMQPKLQAACATLDDLSWSVLRCLPEVHALLPTRSVLALPQLDAVGEAERRRCAMHALIDALAAHGPLLLILENSHNRDAETIDQIMGWVGHARRCLIVLSRQPARKQALCVPAMTLAPLDEPAMHGLLQRALNGPVDRIACQRLVQASGGNPLFLREVLQIVTGAGSLGWASDRGWYLRDENLALPEPLITMLAQRLQPLSPAARALAGLLALLGRPVELELAERLVPTEAERLAAQAELLEQQVVVERGTHLRFDHDWLREELLAALPAADRSVLHARILAALHAGGGDPAERMQHALGAGAWPHALADATAVLERALGNGQTRVAQHALGVAEQAIDHVGHACTPADRWRILTLKETLLRLEGRGSAWTRVLDMLQALGDASAQPAWQAEARLRRGQALREQGQHAAAQEYLEAAVAFAAQAALPALEAATRSMLASVLDDQGVVQSALYQSRAAAHAASLSNDPVLYARTRATQAYVEMRAGDPAQADAIVAPLLHAPWIDQQPVLAVRLTRQRGIIKLANRDFDVGIALLRDSVRLAQQCGDIHGRLLCQTSLVYELIRFGQYEESDTLVDATISLARHLDARLQLSALLTSAAGACLYRDDHDQAQVYADEGAHLAERIGVPEYLAASLGMIARIALARGQMQRAEAAIARAEELVADLPHATVPIAHIAAHVWYVLGDRERARRAGERALLHVAENGLVGTEAASVLWEAATVLHTLDPRASVRVHQERAYALLADQISTLRSASSRRALVRATPTHRAIAGFRSRGKQHLVELPLGSAPTGRPLFADEYMLVVWHVAETNEPREAKARRQQQIVRLVDQAAEQGAAATTEALADVLDVSLRTLLRDLKEMRARGVHVQTRGHGVAAARSDDHQRSWSRAAVAS